MVLPGSALPPNNLLNASIFPALQETLTDKDANASIGLCDYLTLIVARIPFHAARYRHRTRTDRLIQSRELTADPASLTHRDEELNQQNA